MTHTPFQFLTQTQIHLRPGLLDCDDQNKFVPFCTVGFDGCVYVIDNPNRCYIIDIGAHTITKYRIVHSPCDPAAVTCDTIWDRVVLAFNAEHIPECEFVTMIGECKTQEHFEHVVLPTISLMLCEL